MPAVAVEAAGGGGVCLGVGAARASARGLGGALLGASAAGPDLAPQPNGLKAGSLCAQSARG